VVQNDAAFAAKADSGVKCSSLIHTVLTLHLVEMKAEGFINDAWEDHLSRNADIDCDADQAYLFLDEEDTDEEDAGDEEETTQPPVTPKPTFAPSAPFSSEPPTPEPTFDPSIQPTKSPVAEPAQTFSPSFTPTAKPHGTTFEIISPNRNGNRSLKASKTSRIEAPETNGAATSSGKCCCLQF
jgi:hypothetical protein